jgi:hypothetical protein
VAVPGGESPFEHVFLIADMPDVKHIVDQFKMDVTYLVMYNSRVRQEYKDNIYIHENNYNLETMVRSVQPASLETIKGILAVLPEPSSIKINMSWD